MNPRRERVSTPEIPVATRETHVRDRTVLPLKPPLLLLICRRAYTAGGCGHRVRAVKGVSSPSTTPRTCGPTTSRRCPHPSAMLTVRRGPPDSHRMLRRPGNRLRVYRDRLITVTGPRSHRPRHGRSSTRLGRQFEPTIGERIGRIRTRDRIDNPLIHQPVEMRP